MQSQSEILGFRNFAGVQFSHNHCAVEPEPPLLPGDQATLGFCGIHGKGKAQKTPPQGFPANLSVRSSWI